ncbi:MAG: ComF family protein [Anaerolineales bacterium]
MISSTPSALVFQNVDALYSMTAHEGVIREAIHQLKYENLPEVARTLGHHLANALPWSVTAVVPVPLHAQRLQDRGYNQAELIGRTVAKSLSIPLYAQYLLRQKDTRSQVGLSAGQRRDNVQAAFAVNSQAGLELAGPVLLVDDVCTTGATLAAAAEALKEGGAQTVYAATISLAISADTK